MKLNFKKILICSLVAASGMGLSSCDKWLDRQPLTNITPDSYYKTSDQVGAYVINYYASQLVTPQGNRMYHDGGWPHNVNRNDDNTDSFITGRGNTNYFAGLWQSGASQVLTSRYGTIRTWNFLINRVESTYDQITNNDGMLDHYLGEAYFFRALAYYNALVNYGDLPIIEEVLPDDTQVLRDHAVRAPRNEVARFILKDLDTACGKLKPAADVNRERIGQEVALLLKSRVALFEATFEKYHRGTGRVPGDATWGGADKSYNQGKTFDIDGEIAFFLDAAMKAAKAVVDAVPTLTANSHQFDPTVGVLYGWNPYFEMFSPEAKLPQNSIPEVLLWRTYDKSQSISHNAINRLKMGNNDGITRSAVNAYLMKNGLPIYADAAYAQRGDASIMLEKTDRDERLQLFVWGEDNVQYSDMAYKTVAETGEVVKLGPVGITYSNAQNVDITGYRSRKFYCYDSSQCVSDDLLASNACPVFRTAEAYLNYMEACYELNGSLDAVAEGYWKRIRERAGVDQDFDKTIQATIMAKEIEQQHLDVWSGDQQVDATLYNIRRERRCELAGEGFRFDDLRRWRSFDRLLVEKYIVEGINLWDEAYKNYAQYSEDNTAADAGGNNPLRYDMTTDANVSPKEDGKYLRPLRRSRESNDLYDGYGWKKAYYLSPLGFEELQLVAADANEVAATSSYYQNPYWQVSAGYPLE